MGGILVMWRMILKWGRDGVGGGDTPLRTMHPMHQSEGSLKFYTKLENLLLSVENVLAEIGEQVLAKNTQQALIYPTCFIKRTSSRKNY